MKTSFRDYLKQIGKFDLLTAEEELELGRRIKEENDPVAREKLINHNLRLVVTIAKKYQNEHFTIEDLVQEGNLGLITAVERYDYTLGYRFSTCAAPWIRQAISKAIADKGRNIRVPAHIYQLLSKYRKVVNDFENKGIKPTKQDIAKALDIDMAKLNLVESWKTDTMSLSTPLGDESDDTLEDLTADHGLDPMQECERLDLKRRIQKLIGEFKPRTQQIIKLRYGLGNSKDPKEYQKEHTLEEIGVILGITRERVRQIEKETLLEMKHKLEGLK